MSPSALCVCPAEAIRGVVVFTDIFEKEHELPFEMKMLEMESETAFVEMDAYYRGGFN